MLKGETMTKPKYQQTFYTLPIFLLPTVLGLLIIFGIFSFFQKEDTPKSTQIYGFDFVTRWDGKRWGIGQYY